MPVMPIGFKLKPTGFFDRNPGLDVPPPTPHCCEQSTANERGTSDELSTKQLAVVVGATSKWQADGRNTRLAHGKALDDSDVPVGVRWGVGGAIAQKFAKEGFLVVLTTRRPPMPRRWRRPSSSRAVTA